MDKIKTIKSTLRSGHHTGTIATSNGLCLTEAVMGETGKIELNGTLGENVSAEITFRKEYVSPVVVAYIVTRSGGVHSVEVRVNNVTDTGCTIFMEQPNNKHHKSEFVCYIVMEEGSHVTNNGYRIEAGIHDTTTVRSHKQTDFEGDKIMFDKLFTTMPVVLHTLNTYNAGTFATSMAQNVSVDGFELAQEIAETKKQAGKEKIGWIAFEQMAGKGYITDVKGEVGIVEATSDTGVDDKPGTTIEFINGFVGRPDVVVKGQTMNDTDGYWTRGSGAWSKDLIRVYAEEDQRTDEERSHRSETFGYAAFEDDSLIKTIRPYGERLSDIFKLQNFSVNQGLVMSWKTDNYTNVDINVKYSADNGLTWSDWLQCEYAQSVPGLPIIGDLDGYQIQFKYAFASDVEVPPHLVEFSVMYIDSPVLIEGVNVGGYATDGTDWNSRRIL